MSAPGAPVPARLAALLRADAMVNDADVVADDEEQWITAVVVPQGFRLGTDLRDRLFALAAQAGEDAGSGRLQLLLVPAVPRDAAGRVDPAAVRAALHHPDAPVFRLEPAQTGTEQRLLRIVAEMLPGTQISVTDSLPQLGADSIVVMATVGRIEEEFGIDVNPQLVFGADSLRELADLLDATAPAVSA